LLIHLDRVRREPLVWDETVEIEAAALDRDELVALGPIRWRGRVSFADPSFYLRARLEYRQTLRCGRCLTEVEQPVAADVELLLEVEEPARHRGGDEEIELHEQDLGVVFLEGEVFDTRPLLVEQLQLNVPMKPVCREDCRGLCPQCGADLSQGDCSCGGQPPDPRWAALAALRDRQEGREDG
jgi:uncharacterized protein